MDPIISEPTTETKPEEKPTIPKEEPKKEKNISQTQQVYDLAVKKIEEGFPLNDSKSTIELRKEIMRELKIVPNSRGMVRDTLKKVFIEKKLQLSDLGFKNDKIGEMKVNLIKNEITEPVENKTGPTITFQKKFVEVSPLQNQRDYQPSIRGSLPKTQTEQQETQNSESQIEPEKKYMSDTAQSNLIKEGLNEIIAPIYIKLGIVQPDEEEIEEEAKLPTAKQFRKNMDSLGDKINSYLVEEEIKLPAFLNHLSIVISIFMVLVMPIIQFKFSSKQDANPEYDESAEEIEVKT